MLYSSNIKKKLFSLSKLKKREFDPEKMSAEDISLPFIIEDIDKFILRNSLKEELKTFKSLGYKNKSIEELNKEFEYHSYQIGLIIRCLKDKILQIDSNTKEILPKEVTSLSKQQLHIKVFNIVYKYDNLIKRNFTQKQLEEDISWTPLDIAYLLYYLNLESKTI
jgi:hypothetical protein